LEGAIMTVDAQDVTALRCKLRAAGYSPIPLYGKEPPIYGKKKKNNAHGALAGWQNLFDSSTEQIAMWATTWPDAGNTGILTKFCPAIDIDILEQDAAEAVEELARDRFGEAGHFLVRIGLPPKRAIVLRTDEPFEKITTTFIAPGGSEQRIEIMADGQQLAAFGIHPDTRRPYAWHGGMPGPIRREDLPYVREADLQQFKEDATRLLIEQFGYRVKPPTKKRKANGHDEGPADWSRFINNVIDHDSLAAYAMSFVKSGMNDGAVVNLLRAYVRALQNVDEDRRQRRLDEIPGMVASARAKIEAEKSPKADPALPTTLAQVIATFDKWLVLPNHTPIYAVLGAIAANLLKGDPVWLGIIAPPSSAKTEILNALARLPSVEAVGTLTPAALLSGTPKRQCDKNAKGGLLHKLDPLGILVLKDFGSILSMRPDAKAEVLAALREVYDGSWTRHLGTDGGRTLSWSGKVGLVFGVTEAYDDHYGVIGSLGDRFLLCRLASSYRGQLDKALDHRGAKTKVMRDELATAVAGLFTKPLVEPPPMTDQEKERLDDVVSLLVRLRAHVTRDRYSREIENIHGAEGPGRVGLCLERLFMGLIAIGLPHKRALRIMEDVALDSTPPIRRHGFETLTKTPTPTRDIARALKLPTTTTRRALEELAAHGLAARSRKKAEDDEEKKGGPDLWSLDPEWEEWAQKWAAGA
jgi:hypothetical protein